MRFSANKVQKQNSSIEKFQFFFILLSTNRKCLTLYRVQGHKSVGLDGIHNIYGDQYCNTIASL